MTDTSAIKLTIELVPKTSFFNNVRSHVPAAVWKKIAQHFYKLSHYRCDICGGKGHQHPVECHEVWAYDDAKHLQTLTNMTSLCPACHQVKHFGFALINGREAQALAQLQKVNNWDYQTAKRYVHQSFQIWERRSQFNWQIDLSLLEKLNIGSPIIINS